MILAETTVTPIDFKEILFNSGGLLSLAFLIGWLSKRLFGWLGQKLNQSPITEALITAIGKSLQILTPAYTIWLLLDQNITHFPASKQGVVVTFYTLLLSIAHTCSVFQLVAVPIAWAQKIGTRTDNKLDDVLIPMLGTVIKVAVILVGSVKAISIIDPEIAKSVLALLATGAVAVGFAAQDTIKNVFGAVMLIIDQPFTLGDLINTGTHEGHVKALGLRSTTIVLNDGQRLAIPNGDLANRAIVNLTRRDFIRAQDSIHLAVNTPAEKVQEAVAIIRELLTQHEGFDPRQSPLVHVTELSDWSINIRFMYWYFPAVAGKQLEFNQKLLLQIFARLSKAGIPLAAQSTPQAL